MGRPRSEEARRRLIDGVIEILRAEGPDAVTGDEVVRRSGVAKTTMYRHFGTTTALVFAAVGALVTADAPPDTGSLRGDLEQIHRRYLDAAASPQNRALFVWMVSRSMESDENRELFRKARVQPRGPTVVALQRAIARGEIDAGLDLDVAMHVIQGPLISQRIVANSGITDDELDTMLTMTMRGLGVVA